MTYSFEDNFEEDGNDAAQVISLLDGNDAPHGFSLHTGDVLGVLPLRNMVLFPGVLLPVTVSRPKSQKYVKLLAERKLMDSVSLMRKALTECKLTSSAPPAAMSSRRA